MQTLITKTILIVTFLIFSTTFALNDAPEPWQFGFQDPATPIMEGIINFHNHIMFFLTVIGIAVMWLMYRV
jgi:cytochrome c oxidase subunit 2